ncbi:hypothetical protein LJR230_003467 [Trinickia sp. LjRoot230]|uniref:hypothetical protein n=1 Tax=Trinickia sp. LjRoot230 TaxID=3342288 RepID=UPI003ECFAED4
MRHRDLRQTFIARIAIDTPGTLRQRSRGRPRERVVQAVQFGQQCDILVRVATWELSARAALALLERTALTILRNEPNDVST